MLNTDDPSEEEREKEEFERNSFSARSQIQETITKHKCRTVSGDDVSLDSAPSSPRALLAPIDLPKFDGNIQEWEAFFDCFKVMVHLRDTYSPRISKILLSSLNVTGTSVRLSKASSNDRRELWISITKTSATIR